MEGSSGLVEMTRLEGESSGSVRNGAGQDEVLETPRSTCPSPSVTLYHKFDSICTQTCTHLHQVFWWCRYQFDSSREARHVLCHDAFEADFTCPLLEVFETIL